MSDEIGRKKLRRWRWITFAELLAVVTVVISALALLDSHNARTAADAERRADQGRVSAQSSRLMLVATAQDGGRRLKLAPTSGDQVIQAQVIRFPGALGVAPAQTTGDPRIEADWFAAGLKKARRAAGEHDESVGDERLPVAIETQYLADGALRTDRAVYDIGYTIRGQFLGGSSVTLRGMALRDNGLEKDPSARLDKLWAARHRNKDKSG
jgi:hypothetical protein